MSQGVPRSDPIDRKKLLALRAACRRRHVRQLDLFGSALSAKFDPKHSDLDLLVRFEDLPPARYADAYFGLKQDLENLFDRAVDLITSQSLDNPFFRREVERHHQTLFVSG